MSIEKSNTDSSPPHDVTVELLYATIPGLVGFLAVHHWFVVRSETGVYRFEVWQTANAGGQSVGHVHCNLKPPEANVGGGPSRLAKVWRGNEALRIQNVLANAATYPFCHTYHYWPGPNSNTFAAWVLRKAGVKHTLGPKALGKRYPVI